MHEVNSPEWEHNIQVTSAIYDDGPLRFPTLRKRSEQCYVLDGDLQTMRRENNVPELAKHPGLQSIAEAVTLAMVQVYGPLTREELRKVGIKHSQLSVLDGIVVAKLVNGQIVEAEYSIRWTMGGEALAGGFGNSTVFAWMGSEPHRNLLMHPQATDYGLACAVDPHPIDWYCCIVFGRRPDEEPVPTPGEQMVYLPVVTGGRGN